MKYWFITILAIITIFIFGCEKEIERVSETYSQNLSHVTKEYYKYQGECDSVKSNCVYVKFIYPEFTDVDNRIADSLNLYVNYSLLASYEMEMYESFEAIAQSIFEDYNSVKADYEDYSIAWVLEKRIKFNSYKNIATLYYDEYSYLGGAHPNSVFEYYNFDATSGNRLSINDLVLPELENDLIKLGEKKFREIKNIPHNQSLVSAGYWFESNMFYLSESFIVTDSGLVFLYNPYEIAPYAEGVTELFIPNEELKDILK